MWDIGIYALEIVNSFFPPEFNFGGTCKELELITRKRIGPTCPQLHAKTISQCSRS